MEPRNNHPDRHNGGSQIKSVGGKVRNQRKEEEESSFSLSLPQLQNKGDTHLNTIMSDNYLMNMYSDRESNGKLRNNGLIYKRNTRPG